MTLREHGDSLPPELQRDPQGERSLRSSRPASARSPRHGGHRAFDLGRFVTRVLCAALAVIGALPLLAGFIVRSQTVRDWAAQETSRLLEELVGLKASYAVEVNIWPTEIALANVAIQANDGGPEALSAAKVAVSPRFFSLLAGRLDVGDIAIDEVSARLVLKDGKLQNVNYTLPEKTTPSTKLTRAPFTSIALTAARLDLDIDGTRLQSGLIDLDVYAEADQAFEVSLSAGESRLVHRVNAAAAESRSADEYHDIVCQLEARARIEPESILIRRLALVGSAALDATDASGRCDSSEDDSGRVALRLSQLRLIRTEASLPRFNGHVLFRAPTEIANRWLRDVRLGGWLAFSGNVAYDGKTRLPELAGRFKSGRLTLATYLLADGSEGELNVTGDRVQVPHFTAGYADGKVDLTGIEVEPFAPGAPISVKRGENSKLLFESLIRDVDVTPNTIVSWNLDKTIVSDFKGTLDPPNMMGDLFAETSNFEIFDKSVHDPSRRHMIGVKQALVRGKFAVRPDSVQFLNTVAEFGNSRLYTSVKIFFNNSIDLLVEDRSSLDLADISPLLDIPMKGVAALDVEMRGLMSSALLSGNLAVDDLVFGGFPLGDIKHSKVEFKPLKVSIFELDGVKGESEFRVPAATLDFGTAASVLADARVQSERLILRDFFKMWHFDEDPRWDDINGTTKTEAVIRYALGGPEDPCQSGHLRVRGKVELGELDLFDEHFDGGEGSFDFNWIDPDASYRGFRLDVPNLVLKKGNGRLLGDGRVELEGKVTAHIVASGLPLSRLQAVGALGRSLRGELSAFAEVGGTVDALAAKARVNVTPLKLGRHTLPASELNVTLVPTPEPVRAIGTTACKRPKLGPFDRAHYDSDTAQGVFHTTGQLFGGQVALADVTVTRQRNKRLTGKVTFANLNLTALSELKPEVALAKTRPHGALSGTLELAMLETAAPGAAVGKADIAEISLEYGGFQLSLAEPAQLDFSAGTLRLEKTHFKASSPGSKPTGIEVEGGATKLGSKPNLDLLIQLEPTPIDSFAGLSPNIERAQGELKGRLRLRGPLDELGYEGGVTLSDGQLELRGSPIQVSDIDVRVALSTGLLKLEKASMKLGGGSVTLRGSAPLRGLELGDLSLNIEARNLGFSPTDGVRLALDADLEAVRRKPSENDDTKTLPRITGEVRLKSFEYSRPVTMTADLATLTQRGRRTEFESYDPDSDLFTFDITMTADHPLKIQNNLIDASLNFENRSLALSGTNQRFGARGGLRLEPGGQLRLRRNTFEIREGSVEFDDLTQLSPRVDVTAITDYRRYNSVSTTTDPTAATAGSAGSAASGQWHITLRAYGDAEKLRVDLSSSPELSQDDIFLLLTLGLTRAELDQAQSARLGESVALEALGSLTGADAAVTEAIPVIDEFRFGSAYSSRTGQTEPTVTIGKRLSERIRALITSGLSESREVRSNLEWRLNRRITVEGSYDNVNDISSGSLGNLGADVRWRLEFE